MGDALHIEQRIGDLVASWRRRHGARRSAAHESPREMERQVVERLFASRRPSSAIHPADLKLAREMERQAVERLYGERSKAVVRLEPDGGGGSEAALQAEPAAGQADEL
jgi:hypothetical protein